LRAVVGLGNPGEDYATTRHNAGFLLADALADHWQFAPFRRAERARATEGTALGTPVRILKPTTFMNRSGAALASLRADPTFTPSRDLLILVDDFQIPLGTFRFRPDGSAGGHNGLKSIEGALQSQQYARLRIGVGPLPDGIGDWADYVLNQAVMPQMIETVEKWLKS
jgi:PTH1 family peptidyl-tRNA hydrolase